MKIVKLPKKNLSNFVDSLKSFGEIHAPSKRGENSFAFTPVNGLSDIELEYTRAILPQKKYFIEPVETLFNFDAEKGYEDQVKQKKRCVLFGVHPCDIHALNILDLVFKGRYEDGYYLAGRSAASIVGLDCIPDDLCFCRSTGTDFVDTGFDLFLSDIDDSYLVRVGTSLGDDMVRAVEPLFLEVEKEDREKYKSKSRQKRKSFKTEVQLQDFPEIMDLEYESGIWQELGEECLGCGICSMVCPTCYCYAVFDELNLDANSGRRKRRWDSCLFKDYALVAGGLNFRAQRSSRVKNRYFHKHRGFVSQYGRPACVGCGRCSAYCPAGIDIVEVITRLRSETYV